MIEDPYETWSHRDILCRLYKHPTPDGHRMTGYAKIGDEWVEAVDEEDIDEETARKKLNSWVNMALLKAKGKFDNDNSGNGWDPDPLVPDPEPIDPYPPTPPAPVPSPGPVPWPGDPEPNPTPPGPIWVKDSTTTADTDEMTQYTTLVL